MSNSTSPAPAFVDNPVILDLTRSFGAILIGIFFSAILYGVSSLQAFIYSLKCENDPLHMRILVLVLWAADTANQIALMVGAWPVLIKHYGSIVGLTKTSPALLHHIWIEHIVIVSVQLYFAQRIYKLSQAGKATRSLKSAVSVFIAIIVLLVIYEISAVVVYLAKGLGKPLAALSATREIDIGTSLRATAVGIDALLAGAMLYLLLQVRASPHFRGTSKVSQRLFILTIASGTLTALAAVFLVMLVQVYPTELLYTIIEFPLTSLYLSTFLVNLNARDFGKNDAISTLANTFGGDISLVIRGIDRTETNADEAGNGDTDMKMDDHSGKSYVGTNEV